MCVSELVSNECGRGSSRSSSRARCLLDPLGFQTHRRESPGLACWQLFLAGCLWPVPGSEASSSRGRCWLEQAWRFGPLLEGQAFLRPLQKRPSRRSMPRIDSNLPLQWGAMCQCDAELGQLRAALDEEAITAVRQVLSHHTTTACQPGKVPGPVSSLKDSGLEDKRGRAGEWHVMVHLTDSFEEGDGYWVRFLGDSRPNFKSCQAEAAQHLLMMLLANRPTGCTCMRARSGTSSGFAGAPSRCTTPCLQCQAFLQ